MIYKKKVMILNVECVFPFPSKCQSERWKLQNKLAFFLFIYWAKIYWAFFFAFKSRFLIWFDFFFFVFFSISNLSVRRSPTRLWLETWMKPVFPFVNHLLNRKKKKRKKTRRRNKKKKERKSPKEYRFLRLPG